MQPKELTISTRQLTFSALELGDPQGKPVIALHGWMDNAASFVPVAEQLKGIRLIAIDLAGHGRSEHRPKGWSYDIWHYIEDLSDIAEALKFNEFGLLGHSLGGIICTMSAATVLKEQVTGLVVIDGISPYPRTPEESVSSLKQYIRQRRQPVISLSEVGYRSIKQAIRARMIGQYRVSKTSAELLVNRGLRQEESNWVWTMDPRLKLGSPARYTLEQSLAFVKAVTCPMSIIYVEEGEISEFVRDYAQDLTSAGLHPLAGSHHLHMDGQVDAVAAVINTTLS